VHVFVLCLRVCVCCCVYVSLRVAMQVALLNERNVILADKIRSACARAEPGKAVVAVLGMAHVNGVAAILDQPQGVGMSQGQSEKAANSV